MAKKTQGSVNPVQKTTQEKPQQKPCPGRKGYHFTEIGNTQRMLDRFGKDILYCGAFGFLVWNGKYWKVDADHAVQSFAERTIIGMYEEASKILEDASTKETAEERDNLASLAERLSNWARTSEKSAMIASMLSLAKKHVIVEDPEQFDSHHYLFNFNNGTMDVRTGELRPHRREDYLTQAVPFNYNPQATYDTFLPFFSDIMLGRQDLMHFVHKALGLAMTGDTSEQAWMLLLGTGENGKSTLLELISYALGPYACTMSDKTISIAARGNDGSSPTPDLARLKGKRLVTVSETEDGVRLATQLIKRMTGQDKETARFLNKNPFDFHYTHKLFVYTNHEPIVFETGHGFWRRVRRIPFDYTVPPDKKDADLPVKLRAEVEGVLSWLVEGAKLWHKEKLGIPEVVKQATEAYREEQDILVQFIRDCCKTGPKEQCYSSAIFKSFIKWQQEEMNMKPVSAQSFKRMMLDHGYKYARSGPNGERCYHGLSLGTNGSKVLANHAQQPLNSSLLDKELEELAANL